MRINAENSRPIYLKILFRFLRIIYWIVSRFIFFWLGVFFVVFAFFGLLVWEQMSPTYETCSDMPQAMMHYLIEKKIEKSLHELHPKPEYVEDGVYDSEQNEWIYLFKLNSSSDTTYRAVLECNYHVDLNAR